MVMGFGGEQLERARERERENVVIQPNALGLMQVEMGKASLACGKVQA